MCLDNGGHFNEWALEITRALGYDTYVNPIGGIDFFDKTKYNNENIKLEFLGSNLTSYVQKLGHFEAGLSIIDVMMFNSIEEIQNMLEDYALL